MVLVNTMALVAAVVIGFRFLSLAESFIVQYFKVGKSVLPFVAFACLALGAYFFLKWFGYMASKTIKKTLLGPIDQVLGAVFGLFKIAFLLSSIAFALDFLGVKISQFEGKNMILFPILLKLGPVCFKILGPLIPFLKKMTQT